MAIITELSTEILQRIYYYTGIHDLVSLAKTSRTTYRAFLGNLMPLLERAMHNSYSPLPPLLQLAITVSGDDSMKIFGTELRTNLILKKILYLDNPPKYTLAHLRKMVVCGKVAERWTEVYPRLRWRFASDDRRLLHEHEKQRLRGAIYHHWTYTTLFHSRRYTQWCPDPPSPGTFHDPRHRLLRTYSTTDFIQLSEYLAHLELLIELDLYPSSFTAQEQYSGSLTPKGLKNIAWGEGSEYRRLVRDIMKLSPADLLHLVENTTTKQERADFLAAREACFGDVPETLNFALSTVIEERARTRRGLEDEEARQLSRMVRYPSLRSLIRADHAADADEDIPDESLVFGIVDVDGRYEFEGLEVFIQTDGVVEEG